MSVSTPESHPLFARVLLGLTLLVVLLGLVLVTLFVWGVASTGPGLASGG